MSTASDIKDIAIIGAVVGGSYLLYKTFKKDGLISAAKTDLGLSNTTQTIDRRLKTDPLSYAVPTSGQFAESQKGFYTRENSVSYKVLESDIQDLSLYERGMIARGTPISEVKKAADQRVATASIIQGSLLNIFNPVQGIITQLKRNFGG